MVSLNGLDVICMSGVWNLIILLKSNKKRLWVLNLFLISKELGIKLNMNDWILVTIQLVELNWEATAHLIFLWVVPCCSLSERARNLLEDLGLNHKSLDNMKLSLWPLSASELELNGMWSPFHINNIPYSDHNSVSFNGYFMSDILLLCLIVHLH